MPNIEGDKAWNVSLMCQEYWSKSLVYEIGYGDKQIVFGKSLLDVFCLLLFCHS